VTLGLGLTAMSGVEARAADAASLQDEQLQESLGAEHFRATRRRSYHVGVYSWNEVEGAAE